MLQASFETVKCFCIGDKPEKDCSGSVTAISGDLMGDQAYFVPESFPSFRECVSVCERVCVCERV